MAFRRNALPEGLVLLENQNVTAAR